MKNIFVGIDVGKKGAIAIIDNDTLEIYDFGDIKIIPKLLSLKDKISIVCMEKVHSMPSQGVKSMFSFGENYGWWKGVLDTLKIPYDLVLPQKWQKECGIKKGSGKQGIYEVARRLYPNAILFGSRGGLKDGRSDALLIAHYCRKVYK